MQGPRERGHERSPVVPASPGVADAPIDRLTRWLARHRGWLLLALAGLYLAGFTGQWRLGEDSALYLVLGRSLAEGEGYRFGGEWHRFGFPGLPWLLAPLFSLFGDDAPHAATWMMLALTAGTLGLTFRLFRLHAGPGVATAMVLLLGVSENFFRYAFQVRNDMPFLLGIVAALAGIEGLRRVKPPPGGRLLDGGLLAAGLVWLTFMRPTMLTFHAAVVVAGLVGLARGPRRALHGRVVAASVVSVALFFAVDTRRDAVEATHGPPVASETVMTSDGAEAHAPVYQSKVRRMLADLPATLAEGVTRRWCEAAWSGVLAEAMLGIELGHGVANLAFAVAVIAGGVLLARRRLLWGMLVLATAAQLLFFPPIERYFLPIMPLLLYGVWRGLEMATRRLKPDHARGVLAGALILLMGPNLALCVAFASEQRSGETVHLQDGGRFGDLPSIADAVSSHVPEGGVVVSQDVRVLTLLTRRQGLTPKQATRRWSPGDARWPDTPAEAWAVVSVPADAREQTLIDAPWVGVVAELERSAAVEPGDGPGWRLVRLKIATETPAAETPSP